MYALLLAFALLAANPQDKINQDVPTEHRQEQPAAEARRQTLQAVTTYTPIQQKTPRNNTDKDEANPHGITQKIELVPQPPERWFKGYVIATFVIAVINLGMLFIIWRQRIVMEGQLKVMQDGRKQQEQLIRLEHRAWIKFHTLNFVVEPDKPLHVDATFKNTGRTPAYGVRCWVFIEHIPREKSPNVSYENDNPMAASPVMPPDSPLTIPVFDKTPLLSRSFENIMNGSMRVFVHGKITYRDFFKDDHWITFCQEFDTRTRRFMIYDKYNEAD
jgi:hypothetical protein